MPLPFALISFRFKATRLPPTAAAICALSCLRRAAPDSLVRRAAGRAVSACFFEFFEFFEFFVFFANVDAVGVQNLR